MAAVDGEKSGFVAEATSKLEPLIIDKICRPVLERLPERVPPNAISLSNHALNWIVVVLAILAPRGGPLGRPVLFVLAGLGMFGTMILDNLDGMQARRTNRCSKLGELLDHWLDAIHVPLANVGMALALQLPPWAVAGVVISGTMIYHAQVLHYHVRRVFLHPPTSGTDAQLGLSVGFVLAAGFFALVPRQTRWVELAIAAAAIYATVRQVWLSAYFYPRIGRPALAHAWFVAVCAAWGALYLLGALHAIAFALLVTFISFRISGTYVLRSILREPCAGRDWGLVVWIALVAGAFVLGDPARLGLALPSALAAATPACRAALPYLPYAALAYLALRNLVELRARFAELRPRPAA